MPRRVDPGSIGVGKGRVPQGTVADNSLRQPNRDVDPLKVHVHDPSRAHMAATIGIVDAGGFYVSDEVEGALQEIGAGATGFRQNGWYEAGVADFDTAASDAGLTITLAGTWIALIGAGSVDVSGDSILLPNNLQRWVYLDSAGILQISALPPDITTAENVIVGFFTTAGGAVTGKVDGRFFVRNDNRKIDYSVRASGTAADANSEACFFSLDAAILWVDTFNTSGVSRKTHVTIRGSHTISSTVTLGTDNVVFRGEDGATFVSGNTVAPMFDLNGKSGIEFHNITFSCVHAASTAIEDTSASFADLRVEKCVFAGTWFTAINLVGTSTNNCLISDCDIVASSTGIYVSAPVNCNVLRTRLVGSGGATVFGIGLGDPASPPAGSGSSIENCSVTTFDTGASLRTFSATVSSNTFADCGSYAVYVDLGCQGISVTDNNIVGGLLTNVGVTVIGATNANENTRYVTVSDNKMAGVTAAGIALLGYVSDSIFSGNSIDGYAGPATNPGANGIYIEENGAENTPTDIVVTNNSIRRCIKGVVVSGDADLRASGTLTVISFAALVPTVDTVEIGGHVLTAVAVGPAANEFLIGVDDNTTATNLRDAINSTAGIYSFKAHATVSANVVTVYAVSPGPYGNTLNLLSSNALGITSSGATLTGGEYHNVRNIAITDNAIHHCAVGQAGIPTPQTIPDLGGAGVVLWFAQNCAVSGNNIHDIGILLDSSDVPFFPPGAGVYSSGIVLWNSVAINCHGNNILNVIANGIGDAQGATVAIQNTFVEPSFTFSSEDLHFEGNVIEWQLSGDSLTLGATPGAVAIALAVDDSSEAAGTFLELRGLHFNNNTLRNPFTMGIAGVISGGFLSNVSIRGNKISPINGGGINIISTNDDLKDFTITDNVMSLEFPTLGGSAPYMTAGGIRLETLTGGAVSNIENVTISNNTILASQSAINLIATGEGANITITGNTIRMVGSGSGPNYARAVRMNLGTDGVKGNAVHDIILSGNVFNGGDGVRINSESGVLVENVIVTGNTFDGTDNDTDPNPLPDGFYSAFSIYVKEPAGPSPILDDMLRNVVVSGNIFQDSRREAVAITKGNSSNSRNVFDVTVSNNTFNACAAASATTHDVGSVLLISVINASASDTCSGFRIVDNTFRSCMVSNRADVGYNVTSVVGLNFGTSSILGCSVAGNSFAGCAADSQQTDVCVAGAIVVFSLFAVGQLDISRNTSDLFLADAISANDDALSGFFLSYSSTLNTTGLNVIGNTIFGSAIGSATGGGGGKNCVAASILAFSGADLIGSVVSNNNFNGNSISCNHGGVGVEIPSEILLASALTSSAEVCGNHFYLATLLSATQPVVSGAITLLGLGGAVSDATVSNNVMSQVSGGNGVVIYSAGSSAEDLKIRGNIVDGTGAAMPSAVGIASSSASRVDCSGNMISGATWTNGITFLVSNAVIESEMSNNTINGATAYGIACLCNGITSVMANANNIAGPATTHIAFLSDGASINGLSARGNTLPNAALGIAVKVNNPPGSESIKGLNLSDNYLPLVGVKGFYIIGDVTSANPVSLDGVVLSGNLMTAGTAGSTMIYIDMTTLAGAWGSVTGLHATANSIDLGGLAAATRGFQVYAQATSKSLIFQGNSVRNVNGASATISSSFNGGQPDRVVPFGNTSNGGGANWVGWYTGSIAPTNSPTNGDVTKWNFD